MIAAMPDMNGNLIHIGVTVKTVYEINLAFTGSQMDADTVSIGVGDILICVDVRIGDDYQSMSDCRDELIFLHAVHGMLWLGENDCLNTVVEKV